jgi:O-antigen ligase
LNDGAFGLWRAGFARILEAAGLVMLLALAWRMFFAYDLDLQNKALAVGGIGLLARWCATATARVSVWPLLAYAGAVMLSAVAHNWRAAAAADGFSLVLLFGSAWHVVVMVLFVVGTAHLLHTPWRLSIWTILMVVAVGVLASQITFDRVSSDFVYNRAGSLSLPSVAQWTGLFGNSLVLVLGLPLALSPAFVSRSPAPVAAGLTLGSGLLLAAYVNGSRGGALAMLITGVLMVTVSVATRGLRSWRETARVAGALLVLAAIVAGLSASRLSMPQFNSVSGGRSIIWEAAGRMTKDHPLLGVGPGNYRTALEAGGYADPLLHTDAGRFNAHNLFVHTAAETGVIGLAAMLVFLASLVRACWGAWRQNTLPIVAFGVMFAVLAFMAHSFSENFLDARVQVERTRLIVWMVFAAALAVGGMRRRTGEQP